MNMTFNKNIILRIKVMASGKIFVNNEPVNINELNEKLFKLKELNGVVWYFRENFRHMPTELADEVFRKVLEVKLPISLSSSPDFSDWVDENGKVHLR